MVFDLFNSRSQAKFFEPGTPFEGALADNFDGAWNLDALERTAATESGVFDRFNSRFQAKLFEPGAVVEG